MRPMRIVITRTGGHLTGARRAELDISDRPDEVFLEGLVHRSLPDGNAPAPGESDGFHYEITVDDRKFHLADPHLTDDQRELIRIVQKEGVTSAL